MISARLSAESFTIFTTATMSFCCILPFLICEYHGAAGHDGVFVLNEVSMGVSAGGGEVNENVHVSFSFSCLARINCPLSIAMPSQIHLFA